MQEKELDIEVVENEIEKDTTTKKHKKEKKQRPDWQILLMLGILCVIGFWFIVFVYIFIMAFFISSLDPESKQAVRDVLIVDAIAVTFENDTTAKEVNFVRGLLDGEITDVDEDSNTFTFKIEETMLDDAIELEELVEACDCVIDAEIK